jgi:hypothetical protein
MIGVIGSGFSIWQFAWQREVFVMAYVYWGVTAQCRCDDLLLRSLNAYTGKASARMSVESILPAVAKASKFVSKGLAEIPHFAMSKSSYLLHCLSAQFAAGRRGCPNCGGTSSRIS